MRKILITLIASILFFSSFAQRAKFSKIQNLPANVKEINSILPVGDTMVWVGTNCNLLKINDNKVDQYRDIDKPEKFTINRMVIDEDEKLWLGTYVSSLLRFEIPVKITYDIAFIDLTNGEYELITSMCSSSTNIWFGTSEGRVMRYDIYMETFDTISIPVKSEIYSLFIDEYSTIWVCTDNGLFYSDDTKKWKRVKNLDLAYRIIFKDETYWVIGRDEENKTKLMFSDYNRLLIFGMKFEFKKWTHLPVLGIPDFQATFNDIDFDDDGNIWIALDDGVIMYNPNADRFERYNAEKFPEFDIGKVLKIKVQNNQTIWAASINELYKIELE